MMISISYCQGSETAQTRVVETQTLKNIHKYVTKCDSLRIRYKETLEQVDKFTTENNKLTTTLFNEKKKSSLLQEDLEYYQNKLQKVQAEKPNVFTWGVVGVLLGLILGISL